MAHTNNDVSLKLLYEIIFLLDDVEDSKMAYGDCDKVQLNPFYYELNIVLDYCKLFLSNSIAYSYKEEFEVFAFLLPMEKIFEEFVVGFLSENRKDLDIQAQKKDRYLVEKQGSSLFQLKPDILIRYNSNPTNNIIVDTKYKLLDPDADSKRCFSS